MHNEPVPTIDSNKAGTENTLRVAVIGEDSDLAAVRNALVETAVVVLGTQEVYSIGSVLALQANTPIEWPTLAEQRISPFYANSRPYLRRKKGRS